jgi:hypothetical protein
VVHQRSIDEFIALCAEEANTLSDRNGVQDVEGGFITLIQAKSW